MRDIFNSPTLEDAEAMLKRKIQGVHRNQPGTGPVDGRQRARGVDGLRLPFYPNRSLHKKIRTINGVENLNKQIRRRTRVVGIFPHIDSALRLISAVLAEIHDEWLTGRCYLNLESWQEEEAS